MKSLIKRVLLVFVIVVIIICVVLYFSPKPLIYLIKSQISEANITAPSNFETLNESITCYYDIEYEKDNKNSVLDICFPSNTTDSIPVIFFVHGGGFITGDKAMTKYFGPTIASHGYAFISINYDLVPDVTVFEQYNQVVAAFNYFTTLSSSYPIDTEKVFLSGSSAGGFLTLQLLTSYFNDEYHLRNETIINKEIVIVGGLFYSAVYNIREFQNEDDHVLRSFVVYQLGWAITGDRDWKTNINTTSLLNLKDFINPNFPPLFITDGNIMTFTNQAQEYVMLATGKGVSVESLFFDDNIEVKHGYQLNMQTAQAILALQETLLFLEKYK